MNAFIGRRFLAISLIEKKRKERKEKKEKKKKKKRNKNSIPLCQLPPPQKVSIKKSPVVVVISAISDPEIPLELPFQLLPTFPSGTKLSRPPIGNILQW